MTVRVGRRGVTDCSIPMNEKSKSGLRKPVSVDTFTEKEIPIFIDPSVDTRRLLCHIAQQN